MTKETTKYALRRALEQIVPPHVLNRRKLGFPVPTRHWLAEGLHDWARQVVEESQTDEWLDKKQVLAMLRRAPGQPAQRLAGRLLAQALDAAGLHDLARHLRRGADHPRRPGHGLPRPHLTVEPVRPGIDVIPGLSGSTLDQLS